MRVAAWIALGVGAAISISGLLIWSPSIIEYLWLLMLLLWSLFVIFVIARAVERWQNLYVARKVIHILAGGVIAAISPIIFESPAIPLLGGVGMILLTTIPRLRGERLDWFQVEGNLGEVWFCVMWTVLMVGLWYYDVQVAVAATLFMAVGDGVTGIVRNKVYKRWSKGLAGSVAMLLVSLPIGLYYAGIPGVIAAVFATLVERYPGIDDNITVPLVATAFMLALKGVI